VAVSLVVFGVQHFMYGGFVATLVPAFMRGVCFGPTLSGVAFVAAAVGMFVEMLARPAATMLGVDVFSLLDTAAHFRGSSSIRETAMNGPADSWPWECAEAPGFLPARHPFTNTKTADPFLKIGPYLSAWP